MKNNEIMISVRFENIQELSFLVIKDITLRSFIESLYYGLAKKKEFSGCYELFVKYIKVRKELVVLYNVYGEHSVIDFTAKGELNGVSVSVYDFPLDKLGFVTSELPPIKHHKNI